jgi:predicted nucleic acid-binding protein
VILLDASVLLAAEDADDASHGDATRLLESGAALATLDLAVYEIVNVAIRRWRDRVATERLRERAFAIAELGRLVRVDAEIAADAAELADRHEISAYDAAYAAAARRIGATLVSCDERDLVGRGFASLPGTLAA